MAKKSSIVKNIRRQKIVDKFFVKRKELKKIIKNPKTSLEEKKIALIYKNFVRKLFIKYF